MRGAWKRKKYKMVHFMCEGGAGREERENNLCDKYINVGGGGSYSEGSIDDAEKKD